MKISNCKTIKTIAFSLIILLITCIIALCTLQQMVYHILFFSACLLLVFMLFKIRYTTFEISGNCITIRKYHPFTFKKFISPFCELPLSTIKDCVVENITFITTVHLKIKTQRGKKISLQLLLFGFNSVQQKQIRHLLENAHHSEADR